MINFIKYFIKYLITFIYPNRCMFCDEIIPLNEDEWICKYCYMDIDFIYNDKEPFLSVFEYNEKTRYSILRLKYYNQKQYAKGFAKMMYFKLSKIELNNYDFIIPVPMYIKKKRKRGYDQAELLAIELSKLSNIHIESNNLIRNKNTLAQSKVSFEEREKNVQGVFSVNNPTIFKDKNILLIDDIYTSGNTMSECSKELKKCGANIICYFTLSRTLYKRKDG